MRKNLLTAVGLAGLILLLDQASKAWVLSTIKPSGSWVTVVPGFFNLIYAENTNAAFGILHFVPYSLRIVVLTGFAVVVSAVLLVSLVQGRIARPWTVVATGLIVGGALGNALDRIRLGYVVDFIDWHIAEKFHWNVFNVADSAVVVGVIILFVTSKGEDRPARARTVAA